MCRKLRIQKSRSVEKQKCQTVLLFDTLTFGHSYLRNLDPQNRCIKSFTTVSQFPCRNIRWQASIANSVRRCFLGGATGYLKSYTGHNSSALSAVTSGDAFAYCSFRKQRTSSSTSYMSPSRHPCPSSSLDAQRNSWTERSFARQLQFSTVFLPL